MRKINLSNDVKRDAEVAFGTTFHRPTPVYKTADGKKSVNERLVRATMKTTDEALLAQFGAEGLADALINGDPEVDMEQFGLKVEGLKKVYVTPTGKLIPRQKAMRMFMFKKSYQVQHVNGLTYDFLFDMAKKLAEADAMMLVGGGQKGIEPLVMANGGTPYRAFLEGRVDGDKYALILRLTNMELKSIE